MPSDASELHLACVLQVGLTPACRAGTALLSASCCTYYCSIHAAFQAGFTSGFREVPVTAPPALVFLRMTQHGHCLNTGPAVLVTLFLLEQVKQCQEHTIYLQCRVQIR